MHLPIRWCSLFLWHEKTFVHPGVRVNYCWYPHSYFVDTHLFWWHICYIDLYRTSFFRVRIVTAQSLYVAHPFDWRVCSTSCFSSKQLALCKVVASCDKSCPYVSPHLFFMISGIRIVNWGRTWNYFSIFMSHNVKKIPCVSCKTRSHDKKLMLCDLSRLKIKCRRFQPNQVAACSK